MNIRMLGPEDAEVYWELRKQALQDHPEAFADSYEEAVSRPNQLETYRQRFENQEMGLTYGAFDEYDALVGVVTIMREHLQKLRHKAHLIAMYVSPQVRGRGVGRELVTKALEKVRGYEGVVQVNLTVVSTNEAAKKLYAHAGFVSYGLEPRGLQVDGVYYNEDLMVLNLK